MAATIQIGDTVWAKMPTYPLWPAIVIYPAKNITAPYIGDESQHFVKFYGPGTNNCSWIPDKHIVHHSQNLIREARKNKKSKKLQSAIVELEKHLKTKGLIVEKQEEEACTKKRYTKRKRKQEAIKAKNKRTKVSSNKEINDTDVVIEDHNLNKNQKEDVDLLVLYNQIKEKGSAFDGLQIQNKDEHNNSNKIQNKVDENLIVLPNTEDNMEIENQHVQQLEIEKVVPIKDCVAEKDSTSEHSIDATLKLLFSDEILLNEFWKNRSGKKQALQHFLKVIEVLEDEIKKEESLNIQKGDMQLQHQEKEDNKYPKLHQIKDKFDEEENLLKQQGKVTEYSETHENKEKEDNINENNVLSIPEIQIKDKFDEEELLKQQGKVIEHSETHENKEKEDNINKNNVLCVPEIQIKDKFDEEKLLKQQGKVIEHSETHENNEKEDNVNENNVLCVPEIQIKDKFDEEKLLKQQGKVTETHENKEKEDNNNENNVLSVTEMRAIENISKNLADEFFETTILEEKKENTEPFKKAQDTTSSENKFHENVIIPITPHDNDKLQLKSSQKGLNILSDVLPSLIEPFREPNESYEEKGLFKKYLPGPISPIKFGFMGNGILKSSILRNLIKNKLNVILWIDTNKEANNEEYYASGAKTVKTFKDLFEKSDVIFSYWENSKTVKYQLLKVLTSVSTEIFAKKGYVELSTLDPETAYCCWRAITNHGGRFLEAAVLGDIQAADNGDLFLLASGDETVFDDCCPSFSAISTFSHYYTGKIGRGSLMKVGLSMVLGTALAGLAEVVTLIRKYGFKEDEFTDVLNFTPFQHAFWMEKAKSMFKGNRISFHPVVDQRKDFLFGLKLAGSLKLPRFTCSSAKEFFDDNNIDIEMDF